MDTWFLERHQILPNEITGFRQKVSSVDSIVDFISSVEEARANQHTTLAVFFDVEKAFDNVNIPSILHNLSVMGITGRIQGFLSSFLSKRSFQVRLGNTLSTIHHRNVGLPQGCVLSPLLFNVQCQVFPLQFPWGPHRYPVPFMRMTSACGQVEQDVTFFRGPCNLPSQLLSTS